MTARNPTTFIVGAGPVADAFLVPRRSIVMVCFPMSSGPESQTGCFDLVAAP